MRQYLSFECYIDFIRLNFYFRRLQMKCPNRRLLPLENAAQIRPVVSSGRNFPRGSQSLSQHGKFASFSEEKGRNFAERLADKASQSEIPQREVEALMDVAWAVRTAEIWTSGDPLGARSYSRPSGGRERSVRRLINRAEMPRARSLAAPRRCRVVSPT